MKKSMLLCCLLLTNACTHGSNATPPHVDSSESKSAEKADATATSKAQTVSTASDFNIEGLIPAHFSKLNNESEEFGTHHSIRINDLILKDGEAFTIADLQTMTDSDVDTLLRNSCTLMNFIDDEDRFSDTVIRIKSQFYFLNVDSDIGTSDKTTFSATALYRADGDPIVLCRYEKISTSLDEISLTGSIEAVVRKNFGALVSITTIQ